MEKKHYYLRSGDFRPEELDGKAYKFLGYPTNAIAIEQLAAARNLFDSEDEAIEASINVRAELQRLEFVRRERQAYSRRYQRQPDNNEQHGRSSGIQMLTKGNPGQGDEPQQPSAQTASGLADGSSQEHERETTLIIHLHS